MDTNDFIVRNQQAPEQPDRFFKPKTIWDKIGGYFKKSKIQTSDSLDSNLEIETKDSLWFYSQIGYAHSWYEKNVANLAMDRRRRYEEYQLMDSDAEISAALSIWADEATSVDVHDGHAIHVYSDNEKVKKEVEDLFFDSFQIEDQVWGLVRNLCKFGDDPFEIVLDDKKTTVVKLVPIPIDGFYRIEQDTILKEFQFRPKDAISENLQSPSDMSAADEKDVIRYKPYQVAHFTIRTDDPRYRPYGLSILEPARKVWKQLKILEDSLIINRLTRAPERRIFYIDVGNMSPADARMHLEKIKQEYAKKKFYNPTTGEIDEQASPLNQQEDIWIPRRSGVAAGSGTQVEALPGATNLDQIADVNLFRDKILAALKVPPAYLGRGGNVNEGGVAPDTTKAGLSNLDKKFARTIQRVQKSIVATLYKIAYIQLFLKGFSKDDIKSLDIRMSSPSNLDEITALELVNSKLNAVALAKGVNGTDSQQLLPDKWVYKKLLNMSDQEVEEVIKWKKEEQVYVGKQDAAGGGGGGAMPVGGVEGEMGAFGAGTEPEVAGKEEAPTGAQPPAVPVPGQGPTTPAAALGTKQPIAEGVILAKILSSRRAPQTIYRLNNKLTYLFTEGEMDGIGELNKEGSEKVLL